MPEGKQVKENKTSVPNNDSSKASKPPKKRARVIGLDILKRMDRVIVKQRFEPLELILDIETKNTYDICNDYGEPFLVACEESNCCIRYMFGRLRSFDMHIYDMERNPIMRVHRPLVVIPGLFCFPCCLNSIQVFSPPDTLIGSVKRIPSILGVYFSVYNAENNKILYVKGPMCPLACICRASFKVYDLTNKEQVGVIKKKFSGIREIFTDMDVFGVSFNMDLDVKTKGILLGLAFLLDYMYFED